MYKEFPAFYGRRVGRPLSARQENVLHQNLDRLSLVPFVEGKKPFPISPSHPCWMEIGFGDGRFLTHFLSERPETSFIGVEAFQSGIEKFVRNLPSHLLERLFIFPDNVHALMGKLPDQCLDRLIILFPDPWPKKRHHKRRLIQENFLKEAARCLKKNAQLWIASDVPDLVQWMIYQLDHSHLFHYKEGARCGDMTQWPRWPENWPETKYGLKASQKAFMIWEKTA